MSDLDKVGKRGFCDRMSVDQAKSGDTKSLWVHSAAQRRMQQCSQSIDLIKQGEPRVHVSTYVSMQSVCSS